MTKSAQHILEQAIALDYDDRAELVELLADTLEPSTDPEYVAAWEAEIEARLSEIDSGQATMIPVDEAMRMIERGVDDNGQAR